jgi:hypothetical protein
LSAALEEPLLEVPKRKESSHFISGYSRSVHTFVVYKKIEAPKEPKIITWCKANEINQLNNVG